jgi:small subunit ribosomal protein S6
MPTVNAAYEAVLLFSVANGEEAAVALKDKFAELIAQNAQAGDIDDWGKRKLAYLINDEAEGCYVLYNFVSGPEFPAELERVAGITDGVLRIMVIRKEEN